MLWLSTFGRVEAWPEIRDGVPALKEPSPATVATAAARPAPPPETTASLTPAAVAASPVVPKAAPVRTIASASQDGPMPLAASTDAALKPGGPKDAEAKGVEAKGVEAKGAIVEATGAAPAEVRTIATISPTAPKAAASLLVAPKRAEAAPAATAPLPPLRARDTAPVADAPKAERRRTAQRPVPKAAPGTASPAAAAPVTMAEAQPESESPRFLGLPMPDLAPAGRRIRETVEAVGDAMKRLPDAF